MNLFTCFLEYSALRKYGDKTRWEDSRIKLVVLAADENDAIVRARQWFEAERTAPAWQITFGTARRDAVDVRLRGEFPIFVVAESGYVVVV